MLFQEASNLFNNIITLQKYSDNHNNIYTDFTDKHHINPYFKMTSLHPINPKNTPDIFEKAALEELKRDKSNVKISIFCPGPVNTNFNNVADVKFNISSLNSEYASKVAIDGMFMNKLLIIPNNMKFNHLLTKIVPTKSILFVNSLIQERKEE